MDSLPPVPPSRKRSSYDGRSDSEPAAKRQETSETRTDTGISLFHRQVSGSDGASVLGHSIPEIGNLETALPEQICDWYDEYREQTPVLNGMAFRNVLNLQKYGTAQLEIMLNVVRALQTGKRLRRDEVEKLLGPTVMSRLLDAYCNQDEPDIPALLELLNLSPCRPATRFRKRQWQIDDILATSPQIRRRFSGWDAFNADELLQKISGGDRKAQLWLETLAHCTPLGTMHFAQWRLLSGDSIEAILQVLLKKHMQPAAGIKLDSAESLFLGLLIYLPRGSEAHQILLRRSDPLWFKGLKTTGHYMAILNSYVSAAASQGDSPVDLVVRLKNKLSVPAREESWAHFVAKTIPEACNTWLEACNWEALAKEYRLTTSGKARQNIRTHFHIALATEDKSNYQAHLTRYISTLFEYHRNIELVVQQLNQDHIPGPDNNFWQPEQIKERLKLEHPTTTELHQTPEGDFTIDPVLLGDASLGYFLPFSQLSRVLSAIDLDKNAGLGASKIKGVGTGVLAKRSFKKGTIIGEYQGQVTKRMELPPSLKKQYAEQEKKRQQHIPEKPAAVWTEEPSPKFQTKVDLYVAWQPASLMADEAFAFPAPKDGAVVSLGIDGEIAGNDLKELNHSDKPNIVLLAAIDPGAIDWIDHKERIYLKPDTPLQGKIRLVAVAIEDIDVSDESKELTFCYTDEPEIYFDQVGKDILPNPETILTLGDSPWGPVRLAKPEISGRQGSDDRDDGSREICAAVSEMEVSLYEEEVGSDLSDLPDPGESSPLYVFESEFGIEEVQLFASASTTETLDDLSINCITGRVPAGERPDFRRPVARALPPLKASLKDASIEVIRLAYDNADTLEKKDQVMAVFALKVIQYPSFNDLLCHGLLKELRDKWKQDDISRYNSYHKIFRLIETHIEPYSYRSISLDLIPNEVLADRVRDPDFLQTFILNFRASGKTMRALVITLNKAKVPSPPGFPQWSLGAIYHCAPKLVEACNQVTEEELNRLAIISADSQAGQDGGIVASDHLIDMAKAGNQNAARAYIRGMLRHVTPKSPDGLEPTAVVRRFNKALPEYMSGREVWKVEDLAAFMDGYMDEELQNLDSITDGYLKILCINEHRAALKEFFTRQLINKKQNFFGFKSTLTSAKIPCPYGKSWSFKTIAMAMKDLFGEQLEAVKQQILKDDIATIYHQIKGKNFQNNALFRELVMRAHLGGYEDFMIYIAKCRVSGPEPSSMSKRLNASEFEPPLGRKKWVPDDVRDLFDRAVVPPKPVRK